MHQSRCATHTTGECHKRHTTNHRQRNCAMLRCAALHTKGCAGRSSPHHTILHCTGLTCCDPKPNSPRRLKCAWPSRCATCASAIPTDSRASSTVRFPGSTANCTPLPLLPAPPVPVTAAAAVATRRCEVSRTTAGTSRPSMKGPRRSDTCTVWLTTCRRGRSAHQGTSTATAQHGTASGHTGQEVLAAWHKPDVCTL